MKTLEERIERIERRQDEIEAGLQRIDKSLDDLLEQTRKSLDWLGGKPRERDEKLRRFEESLDDPAESPQKRKESLS